MQVQHAPIVYGAAVLAGLPKLKTEVVQILTGRLCPVVPIFEPCIIAELLVLGHTFSKKVVAVPRGCGSRRTH